jgi:hypothetical protein
MQCATAAEVFALARLRHQSLDDDLLVDMGTAGRAIITAGPFTITMDETHQSVSITHTASGETTKIWGDPHVDLHSQTGQGLQVDWDFKRDLTFKIPAEITGTYELKIQIKTTFDPNSPDRPTFSDGVVVNYGDDAVRVDGIYSCNQGLAVHPIRDDASVSADMDGAQADGTIITAKATGGRWDGTWNIDGRTDAITTQIIAEIEAGALLA